MKKIDKILHKLSGIILILGYISFIGVMLVICIDVVMRKVATNGITGAYEIVEVVLSVGVFAGFAYCQSEHGHVHVTLLLQLFPQKLRFFIYGLMSIFSTIAAFAVAYAAYLQAGDSYAKFLKGAGTTGVIRIPYFPFYWVEIVCMIVFGLTLAWDMIKNFIAIGHKDLAEEIQSTWS